MVVSRGIALRIVALVLLAATMAGCLGGNQGPTDGVWDFEEVVFADHWKPGDITVRGIIANITLLPNPDGPVTRVTFANATKHLITVYGTDEKMEIGNGATCYSIRLAGEFSEQPGDSFTTILHFREYTLDGRTVVDAPELECGVQLLAIGMGIIIDVVSFSSKAALINKGTDQDGLTTFEIKGNDEFPPPLTDVEAKILRMSPNATRLDDVETAMDYSVRSFATLSHIAQAGTYDGWPVHVRTPNLAEPSPVPDDLRFVDVNQNGLLDSGDRVVARLQPSPTEHATGMVILRDRGSTRAMFAYSSLGQQLGLALTGGEQNPHVVVSTRHDVRADAVIVVSECVSLVYSEPLALSLLTVPGQWKPDIVDRDGDGAFGVGDQLVFRDVPLHEVVSWNLVYTPPTERGIVVGKGGFMAGYAYDARTVGLWEYNTTGQAPGTTAIMIGYERAFREFHFGRTLVATVRHGGQIIAENVTVVDGLVASWGFGSLRFTDSDASGGMTNGDLLSVEGVGGVEYDVELSAAFGRISKSVTLST